MPSQTYYLSPQALAYIESLPGKNASIVLEQIIQKDRKKAPEQKKLEALDKLRQAATELKELGYEKEAILAWARTEIEGK